MRGLVVLSVVVPTVLCAVPWTWANTQRQNHQAARSSTTWVGLVNNKAVGTEIDLSDEQLARFNEFVSGLKAPSILDFGDPQTMTDQEYIQARTRLKKALEEREQLVRTKLEDLLRAEQFKRLGELYVQRSGFVGIASNPWISSQLDLTGEQSEKLARLETSPFSGSIRGNVRRQREQQLKVSIMAILTDQQKARYKELQGKEFVFSDDANG